VAPTPARRLHARVRPSAQRLSSAPQARKRSVQRRGKGLLSPCIVGRRPSRNDPRQSCLIHEVAYREALTDCFGRVLIAARIEHRDRFGDQLRGQRDILRNDQVTSRGVRSDVLVGHVWTAIYPDGTHKGIPGRCLQTLIRHQDDFDGQSLGGAEYELLDIAWCRIGINPDLQAYSSPMLVIGGAARHQPGVMHVAGIQPAPPSAALTHTQPFIASPTVTSAPGRTLSSLAV
jgi:hypothetical protein